MQFSESVIQLRIGAGDMIKVSPLESSLEWLRNYKPLIRLFHSVFRAAFKKFGYTWELRRFGEHQIGLWRLPLRPKSKSPKHLRRAVFTPGFGDTPLSWLPVLAPLKMLFAREVDELIFVDFPGFGGFLHDKPAFESMKSLRRAYRDVMDSLKPEILMGHSLGGWLAADYTCEQKPEHQPKKLILIAPSGVVGTEESKESWKQQFEAAFDKGFSELRPHVFAKEPVWFKLLVFEFAKFIDSPEIKKFIYSVTDEDLVENRLHKIRSKTWLVWGKKDTLCPFDWGDEWLRRLTHTYNQPEWAQIKGSGHSPQVEKPAVLITILGHIILDSNLDKRSMRRWWEIKTRSNFLGSKVLEYKNSKSPKQTAQSARWSTGDISG